jgi:hypothetical protein
MAHKEHELCLSVRENAIRVERIGHWQWQSFEPTQDGKPLLAGATIHSALLASARLAAAITKEKRTELRLYRGSEDCHQGRCPFQRRVRLARETMMLKVMMSIQLLLATGQAGAADRDKTGTNGLRNPIPTPFPLRILAVPDARSSGAERGNRQPEHRILQDQLLAPEVPV